MENVREEWLDSLKGLGILFVVLGHCFPPQQQLTNYLYSFHIPLFFFISGYFFPGMKNQLRFKEYFNKRFKRLMLPYFGYGIFTYLVWLAVGRKFGVNKELAISPLKPLIGLFYGNGFDNYLVFNIAIWFLPALFSTLILYFWLFHYFNRNQVYLFSGTLALLIIGIIDSKYNNFRLPWGIDISFVAIFFIYLGHQGKAVLSKIWRQKTYIKFGLGILFLLIGYFFQRLNSGVSFNSHSYGNIFYCILAASSSILGYTVVTKVLLNNRILVFLGVNSLKILALHILSFSLISAFIKFVFARDFAVFKVSLTGRLSYFVGSIAIVSLYSIIINKILKRIKHYKYNCLR